MPPAWELPRGPVGDSRSSSALGRSPCRPSPATAGGRQSPKGAGRAIPPVQPRAATSSHRREQIRGGRGWGTLAGGRGCRQGSSWEPPGAGQPSVRSTVGRHRATHGIEPHRAARTLKHTRVHPHTLIHKQTYIHIYTLHPNTLTLYTHTHTLTAEQASWSRVLRRGPAHWQLTALPSAPSPRQTRAGGQSRGSHAVQVPTGSSRLSSSCG